MTDKTAVYSARVPKEVIEKLEGIDRRKAIESLAEMVSEGKVVMEGDRLEVVRDPLIEKFYDACHEQNIEPEEAMKKLLPMIRR